VIWNIEAIAASDFPPKPELIHDILRASASIPVAFPPVAISVESNGKQYKELHVDGGTGSQVFVYPAAVDWKLITKKLKVQGDPRVYVIRNSFLEPDYQSVNRSVLPIAIRSIDSLGHRGSVTSIRSMLCVSEMATTSTWHISRQSILKSRAKGSTRCTWANSMNSDTRWHAKGIHGSKPHRVS